MARRVLTPEQREQRKLRFRAWQKTNRERLRAQRRPRVVGALVRWPVRALIGLAGWGLCVFGPLYVLIRFVQWAWTR